MIYAILICTAFAGLIIGTITDLKKREVPDWISYGLIFAGLGIRLLYSAMTFDWMFFVYGLTGLGIFVVLGYAMFYAGQWGGGDAKVIMGLGALLGFDFTFTEFPLIVVFFINALLTGGIYGLFFSIAYAVKDKKKFSKKFKEIISRTRTTRMIILLFSLLIMGGMFLADFNTRLMLVLLVILMNAVYYLWMFVKSVEDASMYKNVEPEQLTEGDWIAQDVVVDGKKICSPKDLGVEKKQIKQLIRLRKENKISKIKIKIGIPFVPSFLIAFIITILIGAWWMYFL